VSPQHPLSHPVRLNQAGVGVTRVLEPDEAGRRAIARWLDLQAVDAFSAELTLAPAETGWLLNGRIKAQVTQSCGLTLAPLPASVDETFAVRLVEADAPEEGEVEVSLEDDGADVIENGQVDLGHHAVEQLSLALDPFPRAPGAEFVQPEETAEISPFAVLKGLKTGGDASET
jgi:uncharacterized metal-binding protein YceD (DUF177 family)